MVIRGENKPFFFSFNTEIKAISADHKQAVRNLIDRAPLFYKKTLFRSFLNLTKEECDSMSPFDQDYIDYSIMLTEHLMLLQAPFMKTDD